MHVAVPGQGEAQWPEPQPYPYATSPGVWAAPRITDRFQACLNLGYHIEPVEGGTPFSAVELGKWDVLVAGITSLTLGPANVLAETPSMPAEAFKQRVACMSAALGLLDALPAAPYAQPDDAADAAALPVPPYTDPEAYIVGKAGETTWGRLTERLAYCIPALRPSPGAYYTGLLSNYVQRPRVVGAEVVPFPAELTTNALYRLPSARRMIRYTSVMACVLRAATSGE